MRLACLLGLYLCAGLASAGEGRLLATGGATSLEGAAGGGIMPWAVLAGYGERGEWGADVFATRVETGDYRLDVAGVAAAYGNRIELSYARQRFDLGTLENTLFGDAGRVEVQQGLARLLRQIAEASSQLSERVSYRCFAHVDAVSQRTVSM